ncbi:MAG: four helix bundle protein [Phycisphaeraceae bacterium]|nr:four helix bundle protein [Phycisphaeraceae bacterium]
MRYSRFEQVPVWKAAFELGVALLELTEDASFSGIGDIRNQLQRAVVSVGNNIAEGFERGTTNDLLTFLYYAKGSCGEVRSMLLTCQRLRRFACVEQQIAGFIIQTENISRQLAGWAESLQNAEIRGIRYLTDDARESGARKERRVAFEQQLRDVVEQGRLKREAQQAQRSSSSET